MNLNFNIDYRTNFGEDLVLNRIEDDKQGGEKISQYRMNTVDGNRWSYQMVLPQNQENTIINYFYSVENDSQNRRKEWLTETHRVELTASKGISYTLYDYWNDMPEDTYLYSSAFTECINRRAKRQLKASDYERTVRFFVRMPQLRAHQHVCIVGAGDALGNWNVQKALPMVEHQINEWVIDLNADDFKEGKIEFKFVALNDQDDNNSVWESGLNRTVELPVLTKGDVVVYDLSQAFLPVYDQKVAGTLVPVFSLRSKTSFGVGDFGDLKKMVDWVAATHQRALQILPINDTTITHTWTDSYPYSCISIFALHPQYVDLTQLSAIKDQASRSKFDILRKELNALKQIDYERVNEAKTDYLRVIYSQERAKVMKSTDFKKFFKETEQWLVPYAQYCYLRDSQGTADFTQWKGHQVWDEADRKALSSATTTAYRQVEFYYFVQYILNRQMEAVHDYARSKGVILKGDIPIGVNRYGCDVWMEPKYFNMNGQAGAPPDDFSVNGQNWGFPTYNWDEMLKDDCIWWVRRFQNMSKFFDAYRIDHVLGFFRIWEIPIEAVHGLLGQFSPSLGMTPAEIEAYGLHFQEDLFTRPFITDWVLDRMFHERAQLVKDTYLDPYKEGYYQMKPAYDTQRKIEAAFEGKTSKEDTDLRDGLYALVSDVLFVRDRKDCHKFHPRISVQFDFIYESLYDCDKAAFNRLYNDYYYRRNNQFWYYEAMKKLPKLVQATRMLVCAEDLGMVPDCVAWVMNELRILSLEIQSMPKDPKVRFGHLSRNPYRSVCNISSHDMPTLRQRWDEDTHRTQEYYNTMLYRSGAAPHPLPGWLARDIISRHLTSPSMLCILSIQDWLSIDEKIRLADENAERINIPANPKHYWRYRMHLNIEDLLANPDFTANISELILQSGRK